MFLYITISVAELLCSWMQQLHRPMSGCRQRSFIVLSPLLEVEGFYCVCKDEGEQYAETNHHDPGNTHEIMFVPKNIIEELPYWYLSITVR